jgi:apolipoprotein N-acyltransferase
VVQGVRAAHFRRLSGMALFHAELSTLPVDRRIFATLLIAAYAHSSGVSWPIHAFFEHGASVWWLQIVALAVLCWCLRHASTWRQAFGLGWLFATAWLCSTFWWLYVAMHTYAGLHGAIAALAIVALAGALGLYYALAMGLFWHLSQNRPVIGALVFAAAWTCAEMARGTWLTGFGWGAVGYAHADGPLAFYIPWLGAYGVGAIAAWLAAVLASKLRAAPSAWAAGLALLVLGMTAPASLTQWTEPTGSLTVRLLQGNIPQDEKFEPGTGVRQALQWYGDQLMAGQGALVVAPETAIPVLPQQLPAEYWGALQQQFLQGKQAALIGIPLGSYSQGHTNSVIGLAPGLTEPWRYDKHHLVPFGEFIPPLFKWFTQMMNIPLGDFNRGPLGQPSFAWQGQRLAPNICYEDLFGEELGTRFTNPALAPTIFVNVSNIGWFGNSVAIDQHLTISRMRALEFERPFVRATNTGATAFLDHLGQVTAALPRLSEGVLDGAVQGRTGLTPFAWWVSRWGLWPLWLLALAIIAFGYRQLRYLSTD